jgi:chaperonin GroES
MNVRPFRGLLLVRPLAHEHSAGLVIDAPGSSGEQPQEGEVLAVGGGNVAKDGTRVVLEVKVGDRILFGRHAGTEISIDGQAALVVREDQVMANLCVTDLRRKVEESG